MVVTGPALTLRNRLLESHLETYANEVDTVTILVSTDPASDCMPLQGDLESWQKIGPVVLSKPSETWSSRKGGQQQQKEVALTRRALARTL